MLFRSGTTNLKGELSVGNLIYLPNNAVVTGNLTGNVAGDVTGNLTGNVAGDVTGNLAGNVAGDVTGNLTGNTGTVTNGVYTTIISSTNKGTKLESINSEIEIISDKLTLNSTNVIDSSQIRVTEKIRISSNCSVGTYIFKDSNLLYKMSKEYIKKERLENEYYIAPFYQYAIENNLKVKICMAKEVKVYGTPEELFRAFKINKNQLLIENNKLKSF